MVSIDYMEGSFRQAISCNDFSDYVGLAIGKFHKEHGLKWPMFIKFKQPQYDTKSLSIDVDERKSERTFSRKTLHKFGNKIIACVL